MFRADLSGANLRGTEFLSANLSGANLLGAIIDDTTDFHMANLSGAVGVARRSVRWGRLGGSMINDQLVGRVLTGSLAVRPLRPSGFLPGR